MQATREGFVIEMEYYAHIYKCKLVSLTLYFYFDTSTVHNNGAQIHDMNQNTCYASALITSYTTLLYGRLHLPDRQNHINFTPFDVLPMYIYTCV